MPIHALRDLAAPTPKALLATALAAMTGTAAPTPAAAQDFYIGQIIMGAWDFCPRGTAPAAGQQLAINQYQALFALLGTNFGGDGTTVFNVPDLRARAAVGAGSAPGLAPVTLGEQGGQESITLTQSQMPAHRHTVSTTAVGTMQAASGPATATAAAGNALSNAAASTYTAIGQPSTAMRGGTVQVEIDTDTDLAGGNAPFDNRSPYLGMTYCIVTEGLFPPRD